MANEAVPAIGLLRIFFILCVLGAHLREYLKADIFSGIFLEEGLASFLGLTGVIGFVFVSGLSLGLGYHGRTVDWRQFMYRRFIRLWPLYALVVFLHLAPTMYISFPNAIAHLLLLNVFFMDMSRNPGSIWFVAMIFQLYLLFPAISRLVADTRWGTLALLSLLVYVASWIGQHWCGLYLKDTALQYLPDFVFGIWVAHRLKKGHMGLVPVIFGVCLIMLSGGLLPVVQGAALFNTAVKVFILASSFLLVLILRACIKIEPHFIEGLASATLGVFLFHRVIWKIMLFFADPINFTTRFIYLVVFGIPIIFTISWLLQKLYDEILKRSGWDTLSRPAAI